ncbi:MAG: MBL fold metallo-hydrolase [Vulcanibacillus sp.]
MDIKKFIISEMGVNCYLIHDNKEAILIDASFYPKEIEKYIDNNYLKLSAILITHAHFDHIAGIEHLRKKYDSPVYIHQNECEWLVNPSLNGSELFPYFGKVVCRRSENHIIGDTHYNIGNFKIEVIFTPGHSPGGVSYKIENYLFTGDTLFYHSIGRTDFIGGNQNKLLKSIKNKLFVLPEETIVLPGHGEQSTIGEEKKNNPYIK